MNAMFVCCLCEWMNGCKHLLAEEHDELGDELMIVSFYMNGNVSTDLDLFLYSATGNACKYDHVTNLLIRASFGPLCLLKGYRIDPAKSRPTSCHKYTRFTSSGIALQPVRYT